MKKTGKLLVLFLIVFGFIIAGYLFWRVKEKHNNGNSANNNTESSAQQKIEETPVPVKVTAAVKGDLPLRLTFTGQADAWDKATVKAETSGRVEKIFHTVGDYVKKGDLIVKLEDKEKKLALERAKATKLRALADYIATFKFAGVEEPSMEEEAKNKLELARKNYEEALAKYRAGKCSETELKKIEEKLLVTMIETGALRDEVRKATKGLTDAELSLHQAEIELERTNIKAPFSGIIGDIKVSTGEEITSGAEIFRIVNPSSLYIKAFVLESEIGKLRKGMGVRVRFLAFPHKFFKGRITSIAPELDPEKKTGTVYIKLDRYNSLLKPGMSCDVQVEYKILKNVVKVPRSAIIVRSGRPLVFVVKDNVALWRYIELGAQNQEEAEVKKGVMPGELVVVEGQLTLAHQSRVRIVK